MYDFLIVGAGLAGCTFAYLAKKAGYSCIVIEKRKEIGGMCATEMVDDICVHKYGAHIFKTSDIDIWNLVTGISEFIPFINAPKAKYKDRLFSLPINMNTFHDLWGVTTPLEAKKMIDSQIMNFEIIENLEQFILSAAGADIYKYLIKDYTEKQWGKSCGELSPDIMRRIPIRMTFDNNYYDSAFQGIPVGGYSELMQKMLGGIKVVFGADFVKDRLSYEGLAKKVIYTGALDDLFSFRYGELQYRSLFFTHKKLSDTNNFQGVAVMNYTCNDVPYTRVIEHRHFDKNCNAEGTIITYETPCEFVYGKGLERFYSVNDEENQERHKKYLSLIPSNMVVLGRLAEYRYIDMAETIRSSMNAFENCIN